MSHNNCLDRAAVTVGVGSYICVTCDDLFFISPPHGTCQ